MPRDNSKWNTLGFMKGDRVSPTIGDTTRKGTITGNKRNSGPWTLYQVLWDDETTTWLFKYQLTDA